MSGKLRDMGSPKYANGFELTLQPGALNLPLVWKQPRKIFVNSMSDLFHNDVPNDYILDVFNVMEKAHWHTFQVLTKRPLRMRRFVSEIWLEMHKRQVLPNVWLGTSVEDARVKWRVDEMRKTQAAIRFLSIEPLLGPCGELNLSGIDWVIVGGESGKNFRPLNLDWAREVREQCVAQNVAFYFKQVGGRTPKAGGELLDGVEWKQYPIMNSEARAA